MEIQLNNFSIINYNPEDIQCIKFAKDMKEANEQDHFLYNCIDKMLEQSATNEKLHTGYGYIIKEKEKLVGFFRPARKVNGDTLLVDLGIHPEYRHKGYGTKILLEITDFFLDFDDISSIKLYIDINNEYSLKCAKRAGYTEVEEKVPQQYKTFIKRKIQDENKA